MRARFRARENHNKGEGGDRVSGNGFPDVIRSAGTEVTGSGVPAYFDKDRTSCVQRLRAQTAPYSRVGRFLAALVRWSGAAPFREFVGIGIAVVVAILVVKILTNADTRLQVYVLEVGALSFLGFVVLEGEKLRRLRSRTTRGDGILATPSVFCWCSGI